VKKFVTCLLFMSFSVAPLYAETEEQALQQKVQQLQHEAQALQKQLNDLNQSISTRAAASTNTPSPASAEQKPTSTVASQASATKKPKAKKAKTPATHDAPVSVHSLDAHPEKLEFSPAALMADNSVVTYIAGMPVVSSPYLGARPAFDGSDYIVNISSINRDIRLMEQRRRLYRAFDKFNYPAPSLPIVTLSGKVEPIATFGRRYDGPTQGDVTLGANELDIAAALNDKVEAYMGIAYDAAPPAWSGQRVANSAFNLNMGFVNIGNLDQSPFYFTAGQIYVPFGRYSSGMVSAPLTMIETRTKARPFILGYKSQTPSGPFAAVYGFSGDTTLGSSAVGGVNLGYVFTVLHTAGEIGASFISSLDNAGGMQSNGSVPGTTFAGFSSRGNGNEAVKKIPGAGGHISLSFERYNLIAEWVGATEPFRTSDLSFNGNGAQPQALQLEAGVTFMAFDKPSSVSAGYQRTSQALALNLAEQRISGVFNISIWKDTVESLEYRHDIDYGRNQFANGAAPAGVVNQNTLGTGASSDTVLIQIGVYF
jgi:hypothetical protein